MIFKNPIITLSCLLFLTACSTVKVAEKGKIFSGGEITYSIKEVNESSLNIKDSLKKEKQYTESQINISKAIVDSNKEILFNEQSKFKEILKNYPQIHIPKYDILNVENELKLSDGEDTVFKNSILYKAIQDAKNISKEEALYFLKNNEFVMPTNKLTLSAFYPCADISENFKDGYVNLKRTIEISSGEISGEKNISGYMTSIDNKEIRMITDELTNVLKKDTGWIYSENNCTDFNGKSFKIQN